MLLALWIALIGADRIDLAGGHGPFIVTPFLALTPLVIVAEVVRRWRQKSPIVMARMTLIYVACALALLAIVLLSVFPALDVSSSASRTMLLFAHVGGTFAIALLCSDRPKLIRTLALGAAVAFMPRIFCNSCGVSCTWLAGVADSP